MQTFSSLYKYFYIEKLPIEFPYLLLWESFEYITLTMIAGAVGYSGSSTVIDYWNIHKQSVSLVTWCVW